MYLLQPRLLKTGKGVLEGYGHVDSDDGSRRLVRHNYVGTQSREVSALHVQVDPNLAREPGGRGKPLNNCIVSQLSSGRKRTTVVEYVGKGFRRTSASPAESGTGAPSSGPIYGEHVGTRTVHEAPISEANIFF